MEVIFDLKKPSSSWGRRGRMDRASARRPGGPRFKSRPAVFFRGNREIREKSFFFTLQGCQYRTIALDFEEHLGQGLGKNAPFALKFGLWLYIVKMVDLKWKSEVHVLQLLRKSLCCQNTYIIELNVSTSI